MGLPWVLGGLCLCLLVKLGALGPGFFELCHALLGLALQLGCGLLSLRQLLCRHVGEGVLVHGNGFGGMPEQGIVSVSDGLAVPNLCDRLFC